jgi:hypothetical protein
MENNTAKDVVNQCDWHTVSKFSKKDCLSYSTGLFKCAGQVHKQSDIGAPGAAYPFSDHINALK